jgi:hypothetical protein
MAASLVGALFVVLPQVTLVPVASISTALIWPNSWVNSGLSRTKERIAAVQPYRPFRLPDDPAISPEEAGALLNTLLYVGSAKESEEGLLPPARGYPESWLPEPGPEGWDAAEASFWTEEIWARVERGLSSPEREYLTRIADHPGHEEFARLALASSVDEVGGRYAMPFRDDWRSWSLPIPRYWPIRQGAYAHLGIAALRAAEGRHGEAEEAVREVISVGLVLMDEASSLLGQGAGRAIVKSGGEAMVHALRLAGQDGRADRLLEAVTATEAAVTIMVAGPVAQPSVSVYLEDLHARAADPGLPRGLRWEYVQILTGVIPCSNLQRIVFGPDEKHAEWLASVEASLVRFPSEQALFDLMLRGIIPAQEPGIVARILPFSTDSQGSGGSCAQLLGALWDIV